MVDSRQKGAVGEREVCRILSQLTGQEVTRSLESVRAGGADITCIKGFSVEVKRKRRITFNDLYGFWSQATEQARKNEDIPILFMREDRAEWEVVVSLKSLGLSPSGHFMHFVRMDLDTFKHIFEKLK